MTDRKRRITLQQLRASLALSVMRRKAPPPVTLKQPPWVTRGGQSV